MPKRNYSWKRFWYLRSVDFRLTDNGYLADPDGEYGSVLNPDASSFDSIRNLPCLVLLGEPGIGKSTALHSSQASLQFDLGAFQTDSSLTNAIFSNSKMQEWSQGTGTLSLALDSLDEGRLAISNIAKILCREFEQLDVGRLRLCIACRTADWPRILEERLQDLWGEKNVFIYKLAPLRRQDVGLAAQTHEIEPLVFLNEVETREAVPFAIKPVTLEFLLTSFKRRKSFPATKAALYYEGCLGLCEPSEDRRAAGWQGDLSADARVRIAARIAALTIFGGFSAVWNAADKSDVPEGDITLRQMAGGTERVQDIEIIVDEHAISEVLDTGLFASSGSNRLGWSHRTYAEFLAAHYLVEHKLNEPQLLSLFTVPDDIETRLAPQLHETAAWLASMHPDFFQKLIAIDPAVLLLSDVATADVTDRDALVGTLLVLYDEEKLLDSDWGLRSLYRKLAHPKLDRQLLPYFTDSSKGPVVRRVAIDIAEACDLKSVQNQLADLALNDNEDVPTRVQAAYAISRIGNDLVKRRLIPLAVGSHSVDIQDELKGCALRATWPSLLTAEELFASLTPPRNESFGGAYSMFLFSELLPHLNAGHAHAGLKWLATQPTLRVLNYRFKKIANRVLALGFESINEPDVLDFLARIVIVRLRSHDAVFGDSDEDGNHPILLDELARHILVNALVERLPPNEVIWLPPSITRLSSDFIWAVGSYKHSTNVDVKATWLALALSIFKPTDQTHLEFILSESKLDVGLDDAFSAFIHPVELGSAAASEMRKAYKRNQELERKMHNLKDRPLLSPTPQERVAILLEKFETGDILAWWRLVMELTLRPGSTHYELEAEGITALPGWKATTEETQRRIVLAAKGYLLHGNPETEKWLGTNTWYRPAVAGARAFLLLLREQPTLVEDLGKETWKTWIGALMAFPTAGLEGNPGYNQKLVALAYSHAPDELIRLVPLLIDGENNRQEVLVVIDLLDNCWDQRLAEALFGKARDLGLKTAFLNELLRQLLAHDYAPARSLAVSRISSPIPQEGKQRELAIGAAAALLEFAPTHGWPAAWHSFLNDNEFGKAVVRSVGHRLDWQAIHIWNQLGDIEIADLFLWLLDTYPPGPQQNATWMGPREFAEGWRNGILKVLQSRGSDSATKAIQRIMQTRPELNYLKWSLQAARTMTRIRNWIPVEPEFLLQMTKDSRSRLVRSGEELVQVVLESLQRFAQKLHGETPLASNLWNEVRPGVWRPKDEDHFSDNVKQHLDDDLRVKGIVLNREVQIRRNRGSTPGERTDIHIDATVQRTEVDRDVITVIIEAKGCWHRELWTAMETQLAGRYLHESHTQHGIYLVAWFNCSQWDAEDSRKPPNILLPEARERLDKQAQQLLRVHVFIKTAVLDTSLK